MLENKFNINEFLKELKSETEINFWTEFMITHFQTDNIMPTGIHWINKTLETIYINPLGLEFLGLDLKQVIGKTLNSYYPAQIAEILNKYIKNTIKTRTSNKCVLTVANQTSMRNFILDIMIQPVINHETNKIMGVYLIALDITAQEINKQILINERKGTELANQMHDLINKFRIKMHSKATNEELYNLIDNTPSEVIKLTEREKKILYFLSFNHSAPDIAKILTKIEKTNITHHAIHATINRGLYVKFGVSNIPDLVKKAQLYGLIPLSIDK